MLKMWLSDEWIEADDVAQVEGKVKIRKSQEWSSSLPDNGSFLMSVYDRDRDAIIMDNGCGLLWTRDKS